MDLTDHIVLTAIFGEVHRCHTIRWIHLLSITMDVYLWQWSFGRFSLCEQYDTSCSGCRYLAPRGMGNGLAIGQTRGDYHVWNN